MTPVSPDEWAARIPWHVKARAIAALDRSIDARRAELTRLQGRIDELSVVVQRLDVIDGARAHLAARGMDVEGPSRMALLLRETDAAALSRKQRGLNPAGRNAR